MSYLLDELIKAGINDTVINELHGLLKGTKACLSKEKLGELVVGAFNHYTGLDELYKESWITVCKASKGFDHGSGEKLNRLKRVEKTHRINEAFFCGTPSTVKKKLTQIEKHYGKDAHLTTDDGCVVVHTFGQEELEDYYTRVSHIITIASYSLHTDEWHKLARKKAKLEEELKDIEEKLHNTK